MRSLYAAGTTAMPQELTRVFVWSDLSQEKTLVAATACSDSVEVYYALENRLSRRGNSCTVSSHAWFSDLRQYVVELLAHAD
jgi:hypothetical protein